MRALNIRPHWESIGGISSIHQPIHIHDSLCTIADFLSNIRTLPRISMGFSPSIMTWLKFTTSWLRRMQNLPEPPSTRESKRCRRLADKLEVLSYCVSPILPTTSENIDHCYIDIDNLSTQGVSLRRGLRHRSVPQ
ncbi:uncharacterized protein BKA55DRAFT_59054 [Fusarium redolens]|uniref:Uncharacterized protein n=1 Tax=Fusarium redolens TaxID=48865 RepID=A0A9P9KY55_FUSRE|nr:uncharacterized protein BKA55DRAFT_59054 [Fusarium redolens]KAH7270748.1 hypothetical protein BKA55DRAFT_59054 [Fusarium redolens]